MASIPPIAVPRIAAQKRAEGDSWLTVNLVFVLAVSGLLNVLLLVRLVNQH